MVTTNNPASSLITDQYKQTKITPRI